MPGRQADFGEVFNLLSTCRDSRGRGGHRDRGGAVCVAFSAVELKGAIANGPMFNAIQRLPVAGLVVRSWNVTAARRCHRSRRKLQRQQGEHQQDQKSAHSRKFKR